jgi:RNA polymerase sigma factor (sigma-70 family)
LDELNRTDAELIGESFDRPDVFGSIFSRHFNPIFGFASRRIGRDMAGEVASEVFTRAFRLRRSYDLSRPDCLPWLYGIATNVVGDLLRRKRRSPRIHLAVGVSEEDWSAVDDRLVADSVGAMINRTLDGLSVDDRETFLLFALEGLSYGEISEALDIPTGTVGSRIGRARRIIREQIPDLEQITDRMVNQPGTEGSA